MLLNTNKAIFVENFLYPKW